MVVAALALAFVGHPTRAAAAGPCGPPVASIVACENSQPGDPPSDWHVSGSGDPTIQGFATSMSVDKGQTISFKINTPATGYHIDILRIGYYQGNGARKVAAALRPAAKLPQAQPACLSDATTGLVDCGNWAVSASWTVPTNAVSGVYDAHLTRDDTGGDSQIVFVVRDDARHSDMLYQTSDTTWQAYNSYGGNSLYVGSPAGRAYKVSYNRPFNTGSSVPMTFFWDAEYPMVRFLEANGYDVSYTSGADVDANGSLLLNHKIFVSSGHDEYWSANQRANVQAARDAGVSLAFFSGNEMFWKTRWEPSVDGSSTPYRTLVTYKETHADARIDPQDPPTWTGTWRDPRFSPPGDGGRPENALTGQFFVVNRGSTDIVVPSQYRALRFWRNTAVAGLDPGQALTLAPGSGTLGFEWDEDVDNGFRPAGLIDMSSTTASVQAFVDYGSVVANDVAKTHHLTLYRAPSGALVFGAGTVRWSWGLDGQNPSGKPADVNMQQATVNLFADMGTQPATLLPVLQSATRSSDATPPVSRITSPASGATFSDGTRVTVNGTASDTGGVVAGVEVSTDGGNTWHPATGTTSWSYSWAVHGSPSATILSRAVDDSGNIEQPSAGVTVNDSCPCSIWDPAATPSQIDSNDGRAVEVGMRFRSDVAGVVNGIRFYKAVTNTGTHVANLWSSTGQLLASTTFGAESASGWQQVAFPAPVPISAGTTYVASYFAPVGHYSNTVTYFYPPPSPAPDGGGSVDSPPLHALRNTASVANGVYTYGSRSAFPTSTFKATNYWVDVSFTPTGLAAPIVFAQAPTPGATGVPTTVTPSATFNEPVQPATITFTLSDPTNAPVAGTTRYDTTTNTVTFAPSAPLANNSTYTARVSGAQDLDGHPMSAAVSWTFTTGTASATSSIWPTATPVNSAASDAHAVELGVKFRSDTDGSVTGIRFFKGSTNTGTHLGSLWTSTGTLLASATFTGETATGWQTVTFASPVRISAGQTYVASYHTNVGHYAFTYNGLSAQVDNPPLHALASSQSGGNGVYTYASTSRYPTSTANATNYWVDVTFTTTP